VAQATLEVLGRTSGRRCSNPVVVATVEGKRYLVSMLGTGSDWVKNVEAAHGEAVTVGGDDATFVSSQCQRVRGYRSLGNTRLHYLGLSGIAHASGGITNG
jgi:hypothetical protein